MGFPSQVNTVPALGVAGDFCDTNPRVSVDNQQGAFVAGTSGVTVGRFAWADTVNNRVVSNTGAGAPTGFVSRLQQALITLFLGEQTMAVPQGLPITLFSAGGFFAKNDGTTASAIGQSAYANNADGTVTFGSAPNSATVLGANQTIAANTFAATLAVNSFTASIAGQVMTVSAIGTGLVFPGQTTSGAGVDPNTVVLAQLTGTAGSTGTYSVSVSQTVASTTITGSGGCMTITGHTSGALLPGQVVTGTGIPAATTVVSYGTMATPIAASGTVAISAAPTPGAGVTVTGAGAYLTVSTAITGAIKLNDAVTDTTTPSNMPAGVYVSAFISGTGGLGTYMLSDAGATAASTDALAVVSGTKTKFVALTVGAPGELVKMSSHVLG